MNIDIHDGDRKLLAPLFALADESALQVASYLHQGEVLVAHEDGQLLGHVQIVTHRVPYLFEIKSLAVLERRRRQGIGTRLLDRAIELCCSRSGRRLIVSTAAADIDNLRFYQRRGFRMFHIVRDAFGPDTGYAEGAAIDGIELRDQVSLDLELAAESARRGLSPSQLPCRARRAGWRRSRA